MSTLPEYHRHQEIGRVQRSLERDGFPRLQMALLVALTGAAGFLASFLLLRAGLSEMWLRYLAAFGVAYGVFLALLWLWLRTGLEDYLDIPDLSSIAPSGAGRLETGGSLPDDVGVSGDPADAVGEALGTAAAAEEFALPLMVLILVGATLFSSCFVIYTAPALFAELLVDGVLAASLYRRLRRVETRHWLQTAFRRTALPFALTAAIVSASGWGLAQYVPGAHSIGDVLSYAMHR